jgi:UDP-N-acetylglucosamine 1-carboxyvinyltransferase
VDKFVIQGGVPLFGKVRISGAKNAVLPVMAASLLVKDRVTLRNVPDVADVRTLSELLRILGAKVERGPRHTLTIDARRLSSSLAPYELVKRMRASIYVLGPLLARTGRAKVSLPGGCSFGPRPVNFHLTGLEALGTSIRLDHGYIVAGCDRLTGSDITFDIKSVGATAHLMMAASLARGQTLLSNAAREPEVSALADFLSKSGARIYGAGTDEIVVEGVRKLRAPKPYPVIPDRIEAGTYAVAAHLSGGRIEVQGCPPKFLRTVLEKLKASGAKVEERRSGFTVEAGKRIRPVDIHTAPFPGFPTDMQAQFMSLLCLAQGTSVVKEGIYPDRFKHAFELIRMGADVTVKGDTAVIKGVRSLKGAPVMASDLRASAALVLAGLVAKKTTTIDRIYHLDRGYDRFEEKLKKLGARIERVR